MSALLALMTVASVSALSQQIDLKLDPAKTSVKFSLDAALHTVHGTFQVKPGALQFDPASGQISGAILVDAKSGVTGNGMRDRKMHKDVLESERYPEISFLPDRIDGTWRARGNRRSMCMGSFAFMASSVKSRFRRRSKWPQTFGLRPCILRFPARNGE